MELKEDIVITGIGVVSPIGVGKDAFWNSLCEGRSGVRRLDLYEQDDSTNADLPTPIGGSVINFNPKKLIRPRKSLKLMSRDIQLAFAAADMARADAGLPEKPVDPERMGVIFGADLMACDFAEMADAYVRCIADGRFHFDRWGPAAMSELFPLWLLKYLPNMPACHIGIAQDARGPTNSLILSETAGLSAVSEAVRLLDRGQADVMIAGSTGSQIHPGVWYRNRRFDLRRFDDDPTAVARPFDARREGMVSGEGSAAFILETRKHAEARDATVLARVVGCLGTFEPCRKNTPPGGTAIRRAITGLLQQTGVAAEEVGHVNAHGAGTVAEDRVEAQAIRDTLGDVPVTAPKSFFGNLCAGSGAVETAVSVLAVAKGRVPQTLNYEEPDPTCPVNVIRSEPMQTDKPIALAMNQTPLGHTIAVLFAGP
ncbi:MAG: beta-ketoacyl-[acyl-carrier-protein] synthase family protein [Thermoguttaceae bacterium]